jgi:hypothetical protein
MAFLHEAGQVVEVIRHEWTAEGERYGHNPFILPHLPGFYG